MRRARLLLPLLAAFPLVGSSCSTEATFPSNTIFHLAVSMTGNGMAFATIQSDPPGITCGAACEADFPEGSTVRLTATGASIVDWTRDCDGTLATPCSLVMSGDRSATARVATSGSLVWIRSFGSTAGDNGRSLALSQSGDPILTGVTAGPFIGAEAACTAATLGSADVFVSRLSARDGSCQWLQHVASAWDDDVEYASVLPTGEIVVHASVRGPVSLGTNLFPMVNGDSSNRILAAFDDSGDVLWGYGGISDFADGGVGVCSYGDAFYTAEFTNFPSNGLGLQYDRPFGGSPWSETVTRSAPFGMILEAIACDADGMILGGTYLGGGGADTMQFTGQPSAGSDYVLGGFLGGRDGYLVRVDPDGGVPWARAFTSPGFEELYEIVSLGGARVLAAMSFKRSFDVGNGQIGLQKGTTDVDLDMVLITLNDTGSTVDAWSYGGPGNHRAGGLAVLGSSGDLVVVGGYGGAFELASTPPQNEDLFVARLSNTGIPRWTRSFGGTGNDLARSVVYRDGALFVAGRWSSNATPVKVQTFLGETIQLTNHGSNDVVVMRLVP